MIYFQIFFKMAFLNENQFLNGLCLHIDPPHLNHYYRHCLMLQALYIHHLKKKLHLNGLIIDFVLQFFSFYFLLTAPAPFLILFLSLLTVLDFDKVFDAYGIFDVDSPSEEETSYV